MKTLFTTLLLPLGLVLVLLGRALWVMWRGHWHVKTGGRGIVALVAGAFVLLYLASTPLVGRALTLLLMAPVAGPQMENPQEADAVIVLTAGMINAGPVGWVPKPESIHRLAVGYEVQRMVNLRMPVIVSGGHTAGIGNPSEAVVAADFFTRNRSELTPTEVEEVSTNTYESALQLAPILKKRGASHVFLVTDEAHMLRALATYRAHGVNAVPFPAMALPHELGIKAFLPSVYGLGMTTDALYELVGITVYLAVGRISWGDVFY